MGRIQHTFLPPGNAMTWYWGVFSSHLGILQLLDTHFCFFCRVFWWLMTCFWHTWNSAILQTGHFQSRLIVSYTFFVLFGSISNFLVSSRELSQGLQGTCKGWVVLNLLPHPFRKSWNSGSKGETAYSVTKIFMYQRLTLLFLVKQPNLHFNIWNSFQSFNIIFFIYMSYKGTMAWKINHQFQNTKSWKHRQCT